MIGRRLVALGLLGPLLAACGSGEGGEGKPAPATEARKAPAAEDRAAPAPPEEAVPPKDEGRRVTGTAVAAADGGPGPEGKIDVVLDEASGTARGTLEFDGRSLALEGVFDGGQLRLWAAADASDPGAVRRGYVLGRAGDGGALEGDFALSDSGAAWSVRGTWKSDR